MYVQLLAEIGFRNIDNQAVGIAITGLTIVFLALTLITLFIACLPRTLEALHSWLPAEEHPHLGAAKVDDEETAVAIGFALHERLKSLRS